jgi:ABC-type multidrug transport system ATPase subunit
MIHIRNLSKSYGKKQVLAAIDLDVAQGEIVGLLGPNGAGKSTLMKCLVGLVHPDRGEMTLGGMDLRRDPPATLARLGFVPQRVAFPAHQTVGEVIDFYATLKGLPARAAERALDRVGMSAQRHKAVEALSGGMLQRLGLAQALLAEPPLLILDEPTVGLDPQVSLAFRDLLAELNHAGTTILISSHMLSEVERLAHRVAILKNGTIVAIDTIAGLMTTSGLPSALWIRPKGPIGQALAALQAAGLPAEVTGGAIRVPEAHGLQALERLWRAGIVVNTIWTTTPTLEEVFRWLVEKEET